MRYVRFHVVPEQGEWMIEYCDKSIGPFASRDHAIAAAVDAAQESGCMGHETQVVVQDEADRSSAVWTYGHDSYPPAG